jgi:hypothetical protein
VQLTLLDHLRLTFGHVVHRHRAHSHLAHSFARWSRRLRAAEVVWVIAIAYTAGAAAFNNGRAYAAAAAILAGLALITLLVHLTIDLDGRAQTHAVCAGRLWLIRERYRGLLTDLVDESIDLDTARRWRDELMNELHAIYERASLVDQEAYRSASQAVVALDDVSLTDEEIDLFLPKSLHKAGRSAA